MDNASPYWLQAAASLAMDALLARLDRSRGCRPWFWVDFRRQPPQASHSYWDYCDIAGRFVDGLALARLMTGRQDALDDEHALRRFLFAQQDADDGLFYNPDSESPDAETSKYALDLADRAGGKHVDLFCQRAPLLAMTTLLALGDESMRPRLRQMVQGLSAIARHDGDEISFPTFRWARRIRPEWTHSPNVPETWLGYRYALLTGLARYAQLTGDADAIALASGLARFYMRHGDVPPDGRFRGNTHSGGILPATVGIARLGAYLGDDGMLDWAHRVYGWVREQTTEFGFLRDGLGLDGFFAGTCETCGLADLIHLAVMLTDAGLGDYHDDVECIARNQLMENQYRDKDMLQRAFPGIDSDVLAMLHGGFECAALPNTLLAFDGAEGCCIGGGIRALFLTWRASIGESDRASRIDLGFTRSTRHVDVIGYEPWAGRIDAQLRAPRRILIRMPAGVRPDEAQTWIDDRPVSVAWNDRHADFGELKPGQIASLRYPLHERITHHEIAGNEYACRWLGGTVMTMQPSGARYPIYQRLGLLASRPSFNAYPMAGYEGCPIVW